MTANVFPVFMCAGYGKRMLPFTKEIPKPAIDFFDKPICGYSLAKVYEYGFPAVGIVVGHLGSKMEKCFADMLNRLPDRGRQMTTIVYNDGETPSGSGGGARGIYDLYRTLRNVDDVVFMFMNGDTIIDIDFGATVPFVDASEMPVKMVVVPEFNNYTMVVDLHSMRVVKIRNYGKIDESKLIRSMSEIHKGHVGEHHLLPVDFTGMQFIAGHILRKLPEGESDIIDALHSKLLETGEIGFMLQMSKWLTFSTPADILNATVNILNGTVSMHNASVPNVKDRMESKYIYGEVSESATIRHPVYIGKTTKILPDATVGKNACIINTQVESGGVVEYSYLYNMNESVDGEFRHCVGMFDNVVCVDEEDRKYNN